MAWYAGCTLVLPPPWTSMVRPLRVSGTVCSGVNSTMVSPPFFPPPFLGALVLPFVLCETLLAFFTSHLRRSATHRSCLEVRGGGGVGDAIGVAAGLSIGDDGREVGVVETVEDDLHRQLALGEGRRVEGVVLCHVFAPFHRSEE